MAVKVGISILDHQSNATNIEVPVPVWAELGPPQPQLVAIDFLGFECWHKWMTIALISN